ncbi:hypothetical protein LRS13_03595 [Svornostia abyssi]|uniref:Uncharacterized protein n=1 Tax=Svornostia abyssi TaxID=2898438 RepID=A0ABY5PIX1_9ACTN|nr:hypothetical protein LRS13_03595 [Parviterribacteraceae bacterium J379]
MEPAGDGVEVGVPRRRARQLRVAQRELVELGRLLIEDLPDVPELFLPVVVRDLEHHPLGGLDERARVALTGRDGELDLGRRAQQAAQERVLAHDPGVLADVGRLGHRAGELVERRLAAGLLEQVLRLEVLDDREAVDRLALLVQREHGAEDRLVARAEEVLGVEALLDDERVHRPLADQERAENGLLGLDRVRRRVGRRRDGRGVGGRVLVRAHRGGSSVVSWVPRGCEGLRKNGMNSGRLRKLVTHTSRVTPAPDGAGRALQAKSRAT